MRRLLALTLLVLAACEKEAIETRQTDNKHMQVELVFTNDGCKVYRFGDSGRAHYYADCGGTMTTRTETRSTGKSSYTVDVFDDVPNPRPKR